MADRNALLARLMSQ